MASLATPGAAPGTLAGAFDLEGVDGRHHISTASVDRMASS